MQWLAAVAGVAGLLLLGGVVSYHRELSITEDRIQAARRPFNGNVRDYNPRVASMPNLVARLGGFTRHHRFALDPAFRDAGSPPVSVAS